MAMAMYDVTWPETVIFRHRAACELELKLNLDPDLVSSFLNRCHKAYSLTIRVRLV